MAIPTTPPFLPDVLGTAADVRDILDSTPAGSGQISYQSGFPAITAIPLTAGGVAPQREDFNAVNKLFSQHIHFQQSGSVYPWKDSIDYIVGGHVYGYDKNEYACIKQCGPNTADGAQNPINDTDAEYWVLCDPKQIAKNTLDISKLVKRVDDITDWETIALEHNHIYRGENLLKGHFLTIADIMTAVREGDFSDIYVGDYIPASYSCSIDTSVTSTNFRIAAINLLNAREEERGSGTTSPNLCIVPDKLGSAYMNSTKTTAGGYVGSYMYKTVLPAYYNALAGRSGAPFYGYIQPTSEYLSDNMDTSKVCSCDSSLTGAVSNVSTYTGQTLTLMSGIEVFGHELWASSAFDAQSIATQLPMFRLNPRCITLDGTIEFWLRTVADFLRFEFSASPLLVHYSFADYASGIRPRFFLA